MNSWQDVDRGYLRRLLVVLAGPVFVGYWDWFRWPLDADDPGDVGLAARLCGWLEYEPVHLLVAESRVKALLKDDRVNHRSAYLAVPYQACRCRSHSSKQRFRSSAR